MRAGLYVGWHGVHAFHIKEGAVAAKTEGATIQRVDGIAAPHQVCAPACHSWVIWIPASSPVMEGAAITSLNCLQVLQGGTFQAVRCEVAPAFGSLTAVTVEEMAKGTLLS